MELSEESKEVEDRMDDFISDALDFAHSLDFDKEAIGYANDFSPYPSGDTSYDPDYFEEEDYQHGHRSNVKYDTWLRNEVNISLKDKEKLFTLKEAFEDFMGKSDSHIRIQNIKEVRARTQEGYNDFLSNPFLLKLFKDTIIPIDSHSKEVLDSCIQRMQAGKNEELEVEVDSKSQTIEEIRKIESFLEDGSGLTNNRIENKRVEKCSLSYYLMQNRQSDYPFGSLAEKWLITEKKKFKIEVLKRWKPHSQEFRMNTVLLGAFYDGDFRNKWIPPKFKDLVPEIKAFISDRMKTLEVYLLFSVEQSLKVKINLNLVKSAIKGVRRPSVNGDRWVILTFPFSIPVQFFTIHRDGLSEIWNNQFSIPSNSYRIQIPSSSFKNTKEHFENTFFMNNFSIAFELRDESNFKSFFDALKEHIKEERVSEEKGELLMNSVEDFLPDELKRIHIDLEKLSFESRFAVMSLFTQNKIIPDKKFMGELLKMNEKPETLALTLEHLEKYLPGNKPSKIEEVTKFVIKHYKIMARRLILNEGARRLKPHLSRFRKLILTPSRLILHNREEECNNSLIRALKSRQCEEAFCRVRLLDDNFKGMGYNEIYLMDKLKNKIKKNMVLDHKIDFLAYSGSQLRNSSFWAIDRNNKMGISVEQVKKIIGDVYIEKNIAKYGARFGQPFSSSIPLVDNLKKNVDWISMKDTVSPSRSNLLFTDGIGVIDSKFLEEIGKKAKLDTRFLSAIQIRIGGVKGVLAKIPFEYLGEKFKGKKIGIRRSMIKFKSKELSELCLLNVNSFLYGFLNRQILILLVSLGVEREGIMEIFSEYCKMIDSFIFGASAPIIDYSEQQWLNPLREHIPFLLEFYLSIEMQLEGVDPFLDGLIRSYQAKSYHLLKKKTNILVPRAARLMGVIDDFNILEEGEVFVCLSEWFDEKTKKLVRCSDNNSLPFVIEADVMVTRNPCLHPGDIRVLRAVKPENQDLFNNRVNCIVFSAKGEIPVTHMMAGGDLDGDTYFVTWDQRLIPKRTFQWFDYNIPLKPQFNTKNKEVSQDELIDFFVRYNSSDVLGKTDNAHLAIAEMEKDHALSEKALECSKLHAQVIDFAKTGFAPQKEDIPIVDCFPEYMEKGEKFVESRGQTVIQDCYDETIKKIIKLKKLGTKRKYEDEEFHALEAIKQRPALFRSFVVKEWQKYQKPIGEVIQKVLIEIERLKSRFGIKDVFELISGNFTRFQKEESPNDQGFIKSQEMMIVLVLDDLFRSIREDYIDKLEDEREKMKFVSGLYVISYSNHFKVHTEDYEKEEVQVKGFNEEDTNELNKNIKEVLSGLKEYWTKEWDTSSTFAVIPWVLGANELSAFYKESKNKK